MAQETITSGIGVFWSAIKTSLNNMFTELYAAFSTKVKHTTEGGIAIKITNKTGSASVKGTLVMASHTVASAASLEALGEIDTIGIVYEDGVADGSDVWIVVAGIADVYFIGSTSLGHYARGCVAADNGAEAGKAVSEAVPTNPAATDKHFGEIGHLLEARVGAGLAKCVLHFN